MLAAFIFGSKLDSVDSVSSRVQQYTRRKQVWRMVVKEVPSIPCQYDNTTKYIKPNTIYLCVTLLPLKIQVQKSFNTEKRPSPVHSKWKWCPVAVDPGQGLSPITLIFTSLYSDSFCPRRVPLGLWITRKQHILALCPKALKSYCLHLAGGMLMRPLNGLSVVQ